MGNILVGKKMLGIKIADNKEAILFVCDDSEVEAICDADCCSTTWIEHVELPSLGFPALVIAVDDLELPGSNDNDPEHDCLKVYGCKITTDKGDIVIDYRNSSNGYYGGNLCWPDDTFFRSPQEPKWIDVNKCL